jgi:hypothetical protein
MADKLLFPPDWEPIPRPTPPEALTLEEKIALRDAVLAAMAGKPMHYSLLVPLMQSIVPRLTNDKCVELLNWVMAQWHGDDPALWPTVYIQSEE